MATRTHILLVHDGDPIGNSAAAELAARAIPHRCLASDASDEDLVDQALHCRAIVAVGAAALTPAVLAAAELPGIGALVAVTRTAGADLAPLRRSGVPYTVLRPAPLLEDLARALGPALAAGRLTLARDRDPALSWVAARDVARCAIAAIDADDLCGRVVEVATTERIALSELATRVAAATGARLKVARLPRWALVAWRALGRSPLALDDALVATVDGSQAAPLVGGVWSTVESALGGNAARASEVRAG
jgi:uncharacterized protein YbjT (DUF2867 family)